MGAEDSTNRWRRRVEEPEAHSSCLGVLQLQLRKAGRRCWYRRIRLRRISLEWPPFDRSQQQKQEQLEHHGFILRLLRPLLPLSLRQLLPLATATLGLVTGDTHSF